MKYSIKIYAIKHNVTNRIYIGSSKNADRRIYSHLSALRGHRHKVEDMQADFDKYGEDYTITILEEINNFEEHRKEYEWMKKYKSHIRGIGYNYKDHVFTSQEKPKIMLTFDGKTLSLCEWAERTGLSYNSLYNRVVVRKWSAEKAITTPVRHCETYFKRMERLRNDRTDRIRT